MVYEVVSKATGEKFAVKCVEKKLVQKGHNARLLRREVEVMKSVDHPNVLKLLDVFM